MDVKQFTIKRSEWGRCGLKNFSGRCCLGFYCNALGLSDELIEYLAMPSGVYNLLPKEADWLIDKFQEKIINSNIQLIMAKLGKLLL